MTTNPTTQQELNDPKLITKLDQAFQHIISADDVGEAKRFLEILEEIFSLNPDFKKHNPDLYELYHRYFVAAQFVTLYELPEKRVLQLLQEEMSFVLEHPDYDLGRKVGYFIRGILNLEHRDEFKNKIREILLGNKATFGDKRIVISGQNVEPTIANWLKDYYIQVGMDKVDPLKVNEYFVNSPNLKLISQPKRLILKNIFNFFESLRVSSVEFPVYDESFGMILPDGGLAVNLKGQFEKIGGDILKIYRDAAAASSLRLGVSPSQIPSNQIESVVVESNAEELTKSSPHIVTPVRRLEEMLSEYSPDSLEHKAISEELSRLKAGGLRQAQQANQNSSQANPTSPRRPS